MKKIFKSILLCCFVLVININTIYAQKTNSLNAGISKEINNIIKISVDEYNNRTTMYANANIYINSRPSIDSELLGILNFNDSIEILNYVNNDNWCKVLYNNSICYIYNCYLSTEQVNYELYSIPKYDGFKSWMPYNSKNGNSIFNTNSLQYSLQEIYGYDGNYGIRMVNDRYCVALGSYFTTEIGQYFDLILENGTIIPCILADVKADIHTDSNNIFTTKNKCCSEFIVDSYIINDYINYSGDISNCCEEWKSPVVEIKIYDSNIFEN